MTTYALPTTEVFRPNRFDLQRVSFAFASRSQVSGAGQIRPTLGWFWSATLGFPAATYDDRAELEAFFHGLGAGDLLTFAHPLRPIPRGTLRGTPTVNGAHSAGVRTISVNGTEGATLLAGDFFAVSNRLYMVRESMVFGASATDVEIAGTLLTDLANGTGITWDRPTTNWARVSTPSISYLPGISPGFVIGLEEYPT